MARIGVKEGLAQKALDSVKERLDTKYGIMILQPAYTQYYLNLGEISSYPPGYKENAGIFCHNNPWVSIAETSSDAATELLRFTRRPARPTSKISAKSTVRNHMYILRWLQALTQFSMVRQRTAG